MYVYIYIYIHLYVHLHFFIFGGERKVPDPGPSCLGDARANTRFTVPQFKGANKIDTTPLRNPSTKGEHKVHGGDQGPPLCSPSMLGEHQILDVPRFSVFPQLRANVKDIAYPRAGQLRASMRASIRCEHKLHGCRTTYAPGQGLNSRQPTQATKPNIPSIVLHKTNCPDPPV